MSKKSSSIASILLVFVIIIVYWGIAKTFYQQDEWLGYGLYLVKGYETIWQSTGGFWGIIFGQGRILTNLLYFLFYKYFPLNVLPIAVFAITFHIVNTLIVFFLAKKLFKKTLPAFLGSLFFALNSVSQSAVTWLAASINTLPSTTLILIALIYYFRYLESFKEKWIILSFIFVYLSLFFKETGIFLFLVFPLFSLIYTKQNIRTFIKRYWYCLAATFLIVIFRIWGFKSEPEQVALFLTGSSKYFYDSLIVRSILYPLTSLSLSIIPSVPFLNFAKYITNVYYPFFPSQQFNLIAQTVVLDLLVTIFSFVIILISAGLLKLTKLKTRKVVIFWFVLLAASFLPYIIISKSYAYLESRYYYLASATWGVIFAWMVNLVVEKIRFKYVRTAFLIIFVLFIYLHTKTVAGDIGKLVSESERRVNILNQILAIKPKLNDERNIFYVTGDTDYYILGNKVPFQQGFGYTLLTWYGAKSKYPPVFFNNADLYEIGREEYFETNGFGFGYFTNLEDLRAGITGNKFPKTAVTALYYNSKENKIIDISAEVAKSL